MVISIEKRGRPRRAPAARRRESSRRRESVQRIAGRHVDDIERAPSGRRARRATGAPRCARARRDSAANRDRPIRWSRRRNPLATPATTADAAVGAAAVITVSLTSVALNARSMATSQSCGVRNLRALSVQASGRSISAAETARRSPSLARNTLAIRSTAAAGGSSPTKCVTSLVATNRAVDGWRHRSRIARSPSVTPASAYFTSQARFSFRAREAALRTRSRTSSRLSGGRVAGARAAPAPCGPAPPRPPTVQPVSIFASSCTSCCV